MWSFIYAKEKNVENPSDVPEGTLRAILRQADFETPAILKTCIEARLALARVNALAESLPNRSILIYALPLQEARSSSAV